MSRTTRISATPEAAAVSSDRDPSGAQGDPVYRAVQSLRLLGLAPSRCSSDSLANTAIDQLVEHSGHTLLRYSIEFLHDALSPNPSP